MTAPTAGAPGEVTRMFVNGQAMSGGSLNGPLAESGSLLGSTRTAPAYRFWSFRDEFPALQPVRGGGASVPGELYAVSFEVLRTQLLPLEPVELELSIITLEDGRGSLSMRLRDGIETTGPDWTPIPADMGWLRYLELCGSSVPAPSL